MRLFLLAALCVGLAIARLDNYNDFYSGRYPDLKEIQDDVFRSDKEYKYWYDGQALTGIPGSSEEHSGTRIQCLVVLQPRGQHVLMQLRHVRMGKLLHKVPHPRVVLPFHVYEEVEIHEELKEKINKPIKFTYTNGLIHEIVFEEGEQPWSANVKRGILNLLQVNLKEHTSTDVNDDLTMTNSIRTSEEEQKFYRTMEKTLEGECETIYNIEEIPCRHCDRSRSVLNVTKSLNFEKCNKRPQIKYNWRFAETCPTCDPKYTEDKFLKSSTVMTYNISGTRDSFLIESAKVESQYTVVMYNEEASVVNTYVNQTMVLIQTGPITEQINELRSPVPSDSHMMYTLDLDMHKEKFRMEGDNMFHETSPYMKNANNIAIAEDLLRKQVRHMEEEVDTLAPEMFARFVTVLRTMKKQELERVYEQFYRGNIESITPEEKKKIKDIIVNALALAGTHDSIELLVNKIERREFNTFETVNGLRQLMLVQVVSDKIIEKVKNLCESTRTQESFAIKQSCYLALGSLINTLCKSDNKDEWATEMKPTPEISCPREKKTHYIKIFTEKLRSTEDWQERVLYLKALGNTGIDLAVFELHNIILNKEQRYRTVTRTQAIDSLRQLVHQMPKKIQKILMPIYMNRLEHPTVRMVAAKILLKTQPERPLLEIMAKNLNTEQSTQVAHYVYSHMSTLANSTQPCYQKLATDLKIALRFTHRVPRSIVHSSVNHESIHSDWLKTGLDLEAHKIMTNFSFIPQYLSAGVNFNWFGFFNSEMAKFVLRLDQLEPLLYKYLGPQGFFQERSLSEILRRNPREIRDADYTNEIQQVWESLKIRERSFTSEPKAHMAMIWMNQDVAYMPVDPEVILSLIKEGSYNVFEFSRLLSEGIHFNHNYATFLVDDEYKIPTTIGLPLIVREKAPLVSSVRGNIKLTITPETSFDNIRLIADVKPSVAVKYFLAVELWSPILNHGLKVSAKANVFVPIKAHIALDLVNQKKELKITFQTPSENRELASIETLPEAYTFSWPRQVNQWQEAETKTIMGEQVSYVHSFHKECCGESLGVKMQLKGRVHSTPVFRRHAHGTPFWPLNGPNKISLIVEPTEERPEEIELKFTTELHRSLEETLRPTFNNWFHPEDSSEEDIKSEVFPEVDSREAKKTEVTFEINKKHGSTIKRFINSICTAKYSRERDYSKVICKLERLPHREASEPFELCAETELLYPKKPYQATEVRGKKVLAKANVNWGRTCGSEKFIDIKLQAERSHEQSRQEELMMDEYHECQRYAKENEMESPIACYEYLVKASMMKKYKLDIEYQNLPVQLMNVTSKLFRFAKHHYYYQTDVADIHVRNPEGKIQAEIRVNPHSMRHLNITVKTPSQNVTMRDIPLPIQIRPLNVKTSTHERVMRHFGLSPVCKVHTNRYIETFDEQKIRLPLTTCWSVLAKDCSAEKRFSVLIKKATTESEHKEVKILTRTHKIVLKRESTELKVEVNGELYPINEVRPITEEGRDIIRVEKEGPYVKVILSQVGLKVFFDGLSAHVKISPLYMSRQCGLCGHFDYEREDEWRSASFDRLNNVREFFLSYTMRDGQCEFPSSVDKVCSSDDCEYTPEWRLQRHPHASHESNEKYETENSKERSTERDLERNIERSNERENEEQQTMRRHRTLKPKRLNKVIERSSEICFTKEPLPICPSNSYSDKFEETKEVEYTCLDRENFRTHELLSSAQRFPLDEVKNLPTTFTRTEKVVSMCRWI